MQVLLPGNEKQSPISTPDFTNPEIEDPTRDEITSPRDLSPNSVDMQSDNEESNSSNVSMAMTRAQQDAIPTTMRHSASSAHSRDEKAPTSPLIRNSDVLKSEMGLGDIGIMTAQAKASTQNPPQVARQNAVFCSTCNKVFVGGSGITAKCNDIDQNFCSIVCLLRSDAAPRNASVQTLADAYQLPQPKNFTAESAAYHTSPSIP